jgi:hypothetical protein
MGIRRRGCAIDGKPQIFRLRAEKDQKNDPKDCKHRDNQEPKACREPVSRRQSEHQRGYNNPGGAGSVESQA